MLIARRREKLERVAARCLALGSPAALPVVADFSDRMAAEAVTGSLAHHEIESIDFLYLNHAWMKLIDWITEPSPAGTVRVLRAHPWRVRIRQRST